MKKNGHNVIYFGANITAKQLKYFTDQKPVSHLYFHLITNLTHQKADEYVSKLSIEFPDIQIVASGPFAQKVTVTLSNVQLLKSKNEVMKFVEATT